jgi:hypothetical protein
MKSEMKRRPRRRIAPPPPPLSSQPEVAPLGLRMHLRARGAPSGACGVRRVRDTAGDPDALFASVYDQRIAWYPNLRTGVFTDGFESGGDISCWFSPPP